MRCSVAIGFLWAISKVIRASLQWSTANPLSIYKTMWYLSHRGVIMPQGGLPLPASLRHWRWENRFVFVGTRGIDRPKLQRRCSVVQRQGCKILKRSESLDDESDRISFRQVFRDLVMFRIKVAPLNCPIFRCRIAIPIKNVLHKLLSVHYVTLCASW